MVDWHLQIATGTWVLWGYGGANRMHVAPALVVVEVAGVGDMEFPFRLPEKTPRLPAPREGERRTCLGWRFRTNDCVHDTGWKLADSEEDALAAARAFATRQNLVAALSDVRRAAYAAPEPL